MANSTFAKVHQLDHMFGPSNSHRDEFQEERAYTSTHQSPAEGLLFLLQAAQELEEQPAPTPPSSSTGEQQSTAAALTKHPAVQDVEPDPEQTQAPSAAPAAVHHRVPHDSAAQLPKSMAAHSIPDGQHYATDGHLGYHQGGHDHHAVAAAQQMQPAHYQQHPSMSGGMQHYAAHQMPPNGGMYAAQMFPQSQSYMHAQAQAHAHAQAQAQAHAHAQAQAHAQMSGGYVTNAQQYQQMHQGHMMHPGHQPTYVAAAQQHAMMVQQQQAAAQAHAAAYGAQHQHPHAYA